MSDLLTPRREICHDCTIGTTRFTIEVQSFVTPRGWRRIERKVYRINNKAVPKLIWDDRLAAAGKEAKDA